MLAGAGAIRRMVFSNFMFEGFGPVPELLARDRDGRGRVRGLQPFRAREPVRGGRVRAPVRDCRVAARLRPAQRRRRRRQRLAFHEFESPFGGERRWFSCRPSSPDVVVIHGHRGDRHGNVQVVGATSVIEEQARAGKTVVATVEQLVDSYELRETPELTVVPGMLVSRIAEVPYGAHPTGMYRLYDADYRHIARVRRGQPRSRALRRPISREVTARRPPRRTSGASGSRGSSRCGRIPTSATTSTGTATDGGHERRRSRRSWSTRPPGEIADGERRLRRHRACRCSRRTSRRPPMRPEVSLLFESGILDPNPTHLALGVGDFRLMNARHVDPRPALRAQPPAARRDRRRLPRRRRGRRLREHQHDDHRRRLPASRRSGCRGAAARTTSHPPPDRP